METGLILVAANYFVLEGLEGFPRLGSRLSFKQTSKPNTQTRSSHVLFYRDSIIVRSIEEVQIADMMVVFKCRCIAIGFGGKNKCAVLT